MPYLILFHILASIVVGFIGMNRKFGFWGYFFASIALTPFIGILLVLASGKRRVYDRA